MARNGIFEPRGFIARERKPFRVKNRLILVILMSAALFQEGRACQCAYPWCQSDFMFCQLYRALGAGAYTLGVIFYVNKKSPSTMRFGTALSRSVRSAIMG